MGDSDNSIIGTAAFTVAYYERHGFFPHLEAYAPTDGEVHTTEAFEALGATKKVEVIDRLNERK